MTDQKPAMLRGLKVLEFSHTIMGPCAGLLLADLGADVVKIEPAPAGDKTRGLNGFAAGFFATFNRNKRSLSVDLKSPQGQAAVHQLVKSADVVIENYGPGAMERLDCGWDQLFSVNQRLVYLALKGFLAGPWQDRPALDEVVQFQSGLAYMTGPVGQPLRAGASIVDILGATFGVTGVLAALREREHTGQGQRVGSALFESAAFLMASHMAGGATTGVEVPPMTARKGAWGVYDVFQSADNIPLFIGVTSDAQWLRFCHEFAYIDLLEDKRLLSNPSRTAERHWLIPELADRFEQYDYLKLLSKVQRADVSWAPVGQPEDLLVNEQLLAGDGLLSTQLKTASESVAQSTLIPGLPLEFGDSRARLPLVNQPPLAGEHSRQILTEAGVSQGQIHEWINAGVVTQSGEDG